MSSADDRAEALAAQRDREAEQTAIDTSEPLTAARKYLDERHAHPDGRLLHFWRGDFYRWSGAAFTIQPPDAIRATLYAWLDERSGKPNKRTVDHLLDALRAAAFLDAQPPCWLADAPVTGALIACQNGLVHPRTRELLAASPRYFNLNACSFAYQRKAPPPAAWLTFLDSLWPDDAECKATLQELVGLLMTDDTTFQKLFLLLGPKRGGKGTIARVLREMLGAENTSAPTLTGLGHSFGLAGLIGKPLAIISDARLTGRSDLAAVTENLLRISGEDAVSVPRKFQPDWVGTLPTRFLLLTNELPALTDASGALASRFIILPLTRSFYGHEDRTLTNRLLAEMPGIFSWALDGLERLHQRGHLLQPAAGAAMLDDLDRLASPIKAFVADACAVESAAEIGCADLYRAWADWCAEQHRDHPGTLQMFGRNLSAAFSHITVRRPRRDTGPRERIYSGIRLLRFGEEPNPEQAGPRWSAVRSISSSTTYTSRADAYNSQDRGPSRTTAGFAANSTTLRSAAAPSCPRCDGEGCSWCRPKAMP